MMWNPEKYIKAWNFASAAHNGQMVPGTDIPYIHHIGLVAMEAMSAITYDSTIDKPDLLIQCALLHDVIEDTSGTYDALRAEFGAQVADGVLALSKDPSLPSKNERMQDSFFADRKAANRDMDGQAIGQDHELATSAKALEQGKDPNIRKGSDFDT
jgi:(p)ppGpp synthase/HD superfamily hydrolase